MTSMHEQLTAHGIRHKGLRPGTQRIQCPRCPEEKERRKPSLSLTITPAGSAMWLCHRCAYAGGAVEGTNHDWLKQYKRREREMAKSPFMAAATSKMLREMQEAEADQTQRIDRIRAQWAGAKPADPAHPYLQRKGIAPANWRQTGELLMVPLRREGWGMVDTQYITPDGEKRYAKGISTRGVYYIAKWQAEDTINLCEGAATAVAIAARIGETTIAAMSRTNLLPVAQMLRRRHPQRDFMLWADNDHRTPGNPGKIDAIWAAMQVGAGVNVPVFPADSEGTDFLDLWQHLERRV